MSSRILRVNIEEPCTEKWQDMTQLEKGVYCKNCCKEVIDFSILSDTEIVDYIQKGKGEKMCGRFNKEQLNKPLIYISQEILNMNIPLWKKFLAILFICFSGFLTGCESEYASDADIPLPAPVVTSKETFTTVVATSSTSAPVDTVNMVFGNFVVTSETQIKSPFMQKQLPDLSKK